MSFRSTVKPGRFAGLTLLAVIALVVSIGCSSKGGGIEPGQEPEVFDDSIPRGEDGRILTPRDQLEAIGEANPGFGGFVVDPEDGSVTVLMIDPEDREFAERAAEQAVGVVLSENTVIEEVKVERADFPYTDLAQWYRRVQVHVWPEFVGVVVTSGISTSSNRIEIGVTDISVMERIHEILREQGIPLEAVEIKQSGGFSFLS